MEEYANESCSIVYLCTSSQNDVYELYDKKSPPSPTSDPAQSPKTPNRIRENVRALLDEDQGAFDEVFVSSRPEQCLQRLENYANSVSTVILVEIDNVREENSDSINELRDEKNALPFLRALSADVQGARFQKQVLPFVLLAVEDPSDSSTTLDESTISSCLHSGALDVVRSPLRHEDINHLLGHIKERIRSPASLIAAHMTQNLVDSIHNISEPRVASHRPDLTLSTARRKKVESAVVKWHFPASDFNMDELTYGVMFMVETVLQVPDLQAYALPRPQLISLLLETRRQYKHEREVHYHNWRHAVDVAQCIFCFLLDLQLCQSHEPDARADVELNAAERLLTPLDGLILLISAIGHDVGHPGVNNAFLVACNHPLAQTYNDKSVLENYHCAAYSQLLRRHWPALNNIPAFRSTMISTILATDMQRHFEYMDKLGDLKAKTDTGGPNLDGWGDKDRDQARDTIMAVLIKAADISNVARPFDVSSSWAKILMNEFARQGELESELQIPSCLFGGPPDTEDILAAAQSQKGFINLFGFPLFQGISLVMPAISGPLRELENNRNLWDEKIGEETEKRKPTKDRSHPTFDAGDEEVEEAITHSRTESATPQPRSMSTKRATVAAVETSASRREVQELRSQLAQGLASSDEARSSMPFLTSSGVAPLSPSRRSSKDVALDYYHQQQMTANAYQGPDLSPPIGSRRESSDNGIQVHQSYPGSRRGSKDESLTTILVTSGGSTNGRSSPSAAGKTSSPTKPTSKRQSLPQSQKQMAARNSSRSHATSTATATTTQHSPSPPPSTQPSSIAVGGDHQPLTHHQSIPSTEDPFMTPSSWPNNVDGSHRDTPTEGLSPSPTPPQNDMAKDSARITQTASTSTGDSRNTPRKGDRGVRESRSRSRLRGLKFWKKKKSVDSADSPSASP